MAESGKGNPRISTLNRIGNTLGCSTDISMRAIEVFWSRDTDSVWSVSEKIVSHGADSWKQFLFEFVDTFRRKPNSNLVENPPCNETPPHIKALLLQQLKCCAAKPGLLRHGGQKASVPYPSRGLSPTLRI